MTISLPPKGNAAKVLDSYFSPLKVQAQAIPTNTCQVAEGTFWTAANTHQEYFGGTTPTISGTIIASTSKWVVVTLTKDGVLNIVDGDASASPVLPEPSEYKDELPLAVIFVTDANPVVITNEMIFDIRPLWSVPVDSISQDQLNTYAKIDWVNNGLNAKADTTGTNSYEFTLGDGFGSNNGALKINRLGMLADVEIRFNEGGSPPFWEFTNDGINYDTLGLGGGTFYTKIEADATFLPLSHELDLDLHITADQNTFLDALSLPTLTSTEVNQLIGITGNAQSQLNANALNLTNHMADVDVHMTADQNTFMDGLTLTGSPALAADDVNQLIGITGNVQDLIDAANTFENLTDTTIALPTVGDLVQWTGTAWNKESVETVVGSDFVHKSGSVAEAVTGVKTFNDNVIMSGDLNVTGDVTISGANATLLTTNLNVADTNVTLNFGDVGVPTLPSHGSGLTVVRGSVGTAASLIWDDVNGYWSAGLVGSETEIVIKGEARTQPFYELAVGIGGSPAGAVYALGFDVPMPVAGTAGIQVFVNGIKQIEGAGKAYTVTYGNGSPLHVIVTFETGSEPTAGADVEFYGFGYLA